MFYLSWKSQLDILSDKEVRRFINNLIAWHQGEEIELKSKLDILIWTGVLPALEINDEKWHSSAKTSRENGKKGGRKPKTTQQVLEEPTKPVNSKELNVNSKLINVEREELIDNCELEIENSEKLIENRKEVIDNSQSKISSEGQSISSFLKSRISSIEYELNSRYPQYRHLLTMANPTDIKELKNHIDKKDDLEKISALLKELSESRFKLRGNYN